MKRLWLVALLLSGCLVVSMNTSGWAQDEEAAAGQLELDEEAAEMTEGSSSGFIAMVMSGGFMGVVLWITIFLCSIAGIALIVDSFITLQEKKIIPDPLIDRVREAMEQGDVMKALTHCEEEESPVSNVLSAGFSNVEEGFEAVQESVAVSGDLEGEKLMQRVNYLNVVGNLAPMLGLLGTVQGMIMAFASLGTGAGAAQQKALAMNISQALWTTAAGLTVAIPAVAFFFFFRNRAAKIILGMEILTMDLLKVLRNVELVDE